MSEYDPSDLTSTLIYIKSKFGTDAFVKYGRVSALVTDLAPNLKNDRTMLERMSRLGILKEFVPLTGADEGIQKSFILRSMMRLIHEEYIRPDIAATYLSKLVIVFDWKIEVEIPESSVEKMKFDSKRYFQEARDRDFLMGKKAYETERFDEARLLFSKAYGNGNILAGIHLGEIYYLGNGCECNYDKAIPLFVDGMNRGCPLAAEWLAYAYQFGKGVPKDIVKAKEVFESCRDAIEAMCASGSRHAQFVYGFGLLYGSFVAKDENKAIFWLEKAMNSGHVAAGVEVAITYLEGRGRTKDTKIGVSLLEKYARTTNRKAHYELGKIYYYGKLCKKDYKKALALFLYAAKCGHPFSQNYVGDMYYWGRGTEQDYSEARKWYELAEKQGNSDSSKVLGFIYFYGEGVTKDKDKAFKYFKYAADKGDARAQYMLHYFYFAEENYKVGKDYLEKSANGDDVLAQKLLAKCYIGSFGFKEEDDKFVYWIRKAAEQNDAEAQRILGEAYINLGNLEVLPESYPEAIKWLSEAADNGDVQALIILAEIYSAGEGVGKDFQKTITYIHQAEDRLQKIEKNGRILIEEHKRLADFYYTSFTDEVSRQFSFEHYCKVFSAGERSVLYEIGWMYFVNGYNSFLLKLNTDELVKLIEKEEERSDSFNLAFLLGQIYHNGYRGIDRKSQAEKWYLKAKEKGCLEACCSLAIYYISEQNLYAKGLTLLKEAYEKGSVEAIRLLSICYKNGIGVKKSRSKAKALLKEAARRGDEEAREELKKYIF